MLKLRLKEVHRDSELAKLRIRRLDAAFVDAEERHQLAHERAVRVELTRLRTRVENNDSLFAVLGDASSGGGLDSRVFSIASPEELELVAEAGPVLDTPALLLLEGVLAPLLLEGVLARGVILTRAVIEEHSLLSVVGVFCVFTLGFCCARLKCARVI